MSAPHRFTPGPWHLDRRHTIWANGDGVNDGSALVCDAFDAQGKSKVRSEEAQANLRLIAAAPDLLAAAERILESGYVSEFIDEEREDYLALKAAIARATIEPAA